MNAQLAAVVPAELVAASTAERTVTVLAVPWDVVGRTSLGPARFARGSVAVPAELSRVKLLAAHREPGLPEPAATGYLIAAADTGGALELAFHIPPTPEGDLALAQASHRLRDGVSVEVSGIAGRPSHDGVLEISASYLDAVAQVAVPAFAPARFLTIRP